MPSAFLSLPREIRDQIYSYLHLPPPSPCYIEVQHTPRHIHTSSRKAPKSQAKVIVKSKSHHVKQTNVQKPYQPPAITKQNFRLLVNPRSAHQHHDTTHSQKQNQNHNQTKNYTTLSLLRVNRQIHTETAPLFWSNVTFHFPSLHDSIQNPIQSQSQTKFFNPRISLGVIRILKGIGQTSSRLIPRISLSMSGLESASSSGHLPKILQLLRSRARHGALRKVEFYWSSGAFRELMGSVEMVDELGSGRGAFDVLLEALRGSGDCGYERTIRIEGVKEYAGLDGLVEGVWGSVRELHFACGGKLYWDGVLLWEGYEEVGRGALDGNGNGNGNKVGLLH